MPIRPFPLQLNVGTDIASIGRIRAIISKDGSHPKHLVGFLKRILTRRERIQFWSRYGSFDMQIPHSADNVYAFLAGRFAAKEATFKALSSTRSKMLSFHDVVIRTPVFGEPMSAVVLDETSTDNRPIEHEVQLLKGAVYHESSYQPKQQGSLRQGYRAKFPKFDSAWPTAPVDGSASQATAPQEHPVPPTVALTSVEDPDEGVELSGLIARVSISHDGAYATAVCLAAEEPMEGDVGGEAAARGYMVSSNASLG